MLILEKTDLIFFENKINNDFLRFLTTWSFCMEKKEFIRSTISDNNINE